MEQAVKFATALVLACSVAAAGESPLAEMDWLTGGQWEAKTAVAANYFLETRTVVEFGPGKWSMRMRQYVQAKQGEYQQYETWFWIDPKGSQVRYVKFHTQGAAVRGTGEVKDGVLTLIQPATNPYPEMRLTFKPVADDATAYVGEKFFKKGESWDKVKSVTSSRKKLSNPAKMKPPERRGKLDLLKNFAGGEFRYYEKDSNKLLGRHFHRFSLNGRLLVGWDFEQKGDQEKAESTSVIWWDPITRRIESVSIFGTGTVTTGIGRVEEGGFTWDVTDTPREGPAATSRVAVTWTDPHTYEMQLFTKEDGAWKLAEYGVVGRREKPKK